jgi:type II secretory pathway pseudopilin PulG
MDGHVTGPKSPFLSFRLRAERGYVLLTLMLFVSVMVVAAAVVAPSIARQIKREREEELIHRGMEYRRAIRSFAKRTGRFPLRIEELENTDGTRYLRKRYKDPITGGDFRLLHMADIAATGARLNTASPPSDGNADTASASLSPSSTPGTNSADTPPDQNALPMQGNGPAAPVAPPANGSAGGTDLGGGLIFGVVSPSAKKTIREFDHKSHYNQWLFFYSAIYDGSVEVKGPTPMSPVFAAPKASPDASSQPASASPPQQ